MLKIGKIVLCPLLLFACLSGIVHAAGPDITTHVYGAKKQALSSSNDTVAAGYYAATTLHGVDGDLAAGNIKTGVAIFGITGTLTGHNLPDTGQTASYTTGDDGYYSGTQPNYTVSSTLGTVTDNNTGLIWVQSGYGCDTTNPPTTIAGTHGLWCQYTAPNAILYCKQLNYAGQVDWRLPNIRELGSIVDYSKTSGSFINTDVFKNTHTGANGEGYYWSSTALVGVSVYQWVVNFDGEVGGNVLYSAGYSGATWYVRCVRGQ